MSRFIYKVPIDDVKYRKLNKDKSINSYFGVKYVGKCVKIFNDYYLSTVKITKEGWEKYYGDNFGYQKLGYVMGKIQEKCYSYGLNDAEIKKYILHRVIGQTWNGMMNEEIVISELNRSFPKCTFNKTTFEIDHEYCIDWEMFYKGSLLLGIQVKPISYKYMSTPYQLRAKENHKIKNKSYSQQYAPYVYAYYKDGEIKEKEELINKINTILYTKT